jgi:hypothetical protein
VRGGGGEKWNDTKEPRLKPGGKKYCATSAGPGQWATATKRAFVDMVKVNRSSRYLALALRACAEIDDFPNKVLVVNEKKEGKIAQLGRHRQPMILVLQ